MTEQQWFTSTNPAEMYTFVKDKVTERQMWFFVESCRHLCAKNCIHPIDNVHWTLSSAFTAWIEWSKETIVSKPYRADLLREIIGNPFRPMVFGAIGSKCNHSFVPNPNGEDRCRFVVSDDGNWGLFHCDKPLLSHSSILDPAWLTWNNGTVANLARAIMEERCEVCYGTGAIFLGINVDGIEDWGTCQLCIEGKGYIPRAEPQWNLMPILADALEEAGCAEAAILDHLRGTESCPYCKGIGRWRTRIGFLNRDEYCSHCNGTGKHLVRHVRGCWVIELLKE